MLNAQLSHIDCESIDLRFLFNNYEMVDKRSSATCESTKSKIETFTFMCPQNSHFHESLRQHAGSAQAGEHIARTFASPREVSCTCISIVNADLSIDLSTDLSADLSTDLSTDLSMQRRGLVPCSHPW